MLQSASNKGMPQFFGALRQNLGKIVKSTFYGGRRWIILWAEAESTWRKK